MLIEMRFVRVRIKQCIIKFFKKLLDIGDILGIEGSVFKTKVGEISVMVKKITILSKSLKPPPSA